LAVRDCSLASRDEIPDFVPDELGRRGGLDPELVQRLQLEQRVRKLIGDLSSPFADDRRTAANALASIGPKAKAAIPSLVSAFGDKDLGVCVSASEALLRIGLASAQPLIAALQDERPSVRARAALVLGRVGDVAKASIPRLIVLLEDEHPGVRRPAADALGRLGPDAKDAVPGLIRMLRDEDHDAPRYAAEALGRIGPDAKRAVPGLVAALRADKAWVREHAATALACIDADTDITIPALEKLLDDSEETVRSAAVEAIRRLRR
jgi:HEAT repeat protein